MILSRYSSKTFTFVHFKLYNSIENKIFLELLFIFVFSRDVLSTINTFGRDFSRFLHKFNLIVYSRFLV